jgi:hypothetical protein
MTCKLPFRLCVLCCFLFLVLHSVLNYGRATGFAFAKRIKLN